MLGHHKRVLMIAAHPDDEDTELLTVLVRGMGAEAGYLSLNRGEGGQNLIGSELGEALGLLRSEELLAARRLDGAQQFFTRAYDFGFSKNLTDTWAHWPQDSVLKDVVRIIRRFRPQIVVSIFTGTPRDGHGQHQAAGWAAQEAYRVAGDSSVFPELLTEEGLPPWMPLKLYRSARFDTAATTLTLDGGALDPAVGQSYHQIAMRGRSLHRSQDMGQLQGMGPSVVRLQLLNDRTGQGSSGLWAGLDTTLTAALATALPVAAGAEAVAPLLTRYEARVDSARSLVGAGYRAALRQLLARAGEDLDGADRLVEAAVPESRREQDRMIRRREGDLFLGELRRLERARLRSLDLIADGISPDVRVAPGQRIGVTASVWNPSDAPAVAALCLETPSLGWRLRVDSATSSPLTPNSRDDDCMAYQAQAGWRAGDSILDPIPAGKLAAARLEAIVPESAQYSGPYFLRRPRVGDLYQWDPEARESWGLPFEPSRFALTVLAPPPHGIRGETTEITFRGNDQGSGEYRRPLVVVPRVDVRLEPALEVWPLQRRDARTFTVTLVHGGPDTTQGTIGLDVPPGWAAPARVPFRLVREDERAIFSFTVRPPVGVQAGGFSISASARDAQGRVYDVGLRTVDHPHIRPRTWVEPAVATARVADLALPKLRGIAYIRGAADRVPEALTSVGLPLTLITGADLVRDLSRYDVIVVGSRAFETDPDLPRNNERLLAYVRAGGVVIMQYQQYGYFLGNFAPYPLTVGSRPPGQPNSSATTTTRASAQAVQSTALLGGHDRVTDETAPVTVVDQSSPILRAPNRIGPVDWEGWVQERGLYFAHTWDSTWKPVLEMHDPGEPPLEGGLLVAPVGKGTYLYTGLSFFRQLPAGVPGPWRLFANLLGLGAARGSGRPHTDAPRPGHE